MHALCWPPLTTTHSQVESFRKAEKQRQLRREQRADEQQLRANTVLLHESRLKSLAMGERAQKRLQARQEDVHANEAWIEQALQGIAAQPHKARAAVQKVWGEIRLSETILEHAQCELYRMGTALLRYSTSAKALAHEVPSLVLAPCSVRWCCPGIPTVLPGCAARRRRWRAARRR